MKCRFINGTENRFTSRAPQGARGLKYLLHIVLRETEEVAPRKGRVG